MGRFTWLFVGLILGAGGMFISMKYHVVRAESGVHLIPKATAKFSIPYVDIRKFEFSDWNERRDLALAIVKADKSHLLEDATTSGLRQTMESVISNLSASATGSS